MLNEKTLEAIFRLRSPVLRCSCGILYDLISVLKIDKHYAILKAHHKDGFLITKYDTTLVYSFKEDKVVYDEKVGGSSFCIEDFDAIEFLAKFKKSQIQKKQ